MKNLIKKIIKEELNKTKLNEMNSFERKVADLGYSRKTISNIKNAWGDAEASIMEADLITFLINEYNFYGGRSEGQARISELKEYCMAAFKVVDQWIEENDEEY